LINALNEGGNRKVIESLTTFYTERPDIEPPFTDAENSIYEDHKLPAWSGIASPLIVGDAYYFYSSLRDVFADGSYGGSPITPAIGYEPIAKVASSDLPNLNNYVNIDLRAPDEIIIRSVQQYVAYAREELNMASVKKRISPTKFESWERTLLLPYLDLRIWLRASGLNLKKPEIAQILCRHGKNFKRGDDAIREAKLLFGDDLDCRTDFLETLTAQGIYELEENRAVHQFLKIGMPARKIADRLSITMKAVALHKRYPI